MRKISVKGVLIGGIVDIVASVVLGLPFALYTALKVDLSHTPNSQASTAGTAAIHGNVPLYAAQLLVGLACSALGGYVAAWLAKHDESLNGALSSILCVALSIYTISTGRVAQVPGEVSTTTEDGCPRCLAFGHLGFTYDGGLYL